MKLTESDIKYLTRKVQSILSEESGYYPVGAEYDSSAPWNEQDGPEASESDFKFDVMENPEQYDFFEFLGRDGEAQYDKLDPEGNFVDNILYDKEKGLDIFRNSLYKFGWGENAVKAIVEGIREAIANHPECKEAGEFMAQFAQKYVDWAGEKFSERWLEMEHEDGDQFEDW